MNNSFIIRFLFLLLFSGSFFLTNVASAQGTSVSVQVFYDELSPYGTWVNNPEYGYVWYPNAGAGFSPYDTNGYWAYTDYGWTWVSGYSWGWAPFHYGRWYHDPFYGPMWVPGNEWGPGWVTWRQSSGYYGWVPIGPGVSINVAYGSGYSVPHNQWRFVRNQDFGRKNINNYYIDNSNNVTIINNSTVINNSRVDNKRNVTYNAGPQKNEVEKHSGNPITPVGIRESNNRGQNISNNQMDLYRPQVQNTNNNGTKAAPGKVQEYKKDPGPEKSTGNTPVKKEVQTGKQPPTQATKQPQPNKPVQPSHEAGSKSTPSNNQGGEKQQPHPSQQTQQEPAKQPSQANPGKNSQPARVNPQPKQQQNVQPQPKQHAQPNQQAKPRPQQNPGGQKQSPSHSQPGKPKH